MLLISSLSSVYYILCPSLGPNLIVFYFTENGDDVQDIVLSNDIPSNISSHAPQENNEEDGAEVIVFTMDGSDDLYGIQVTHDETGNIQKYQFKFRFGIILIYLIKKILFIFDILEQHRMVNWNQFQKRLPFFQMKIK